MFVEPSQASETLGAIVSKEVKGREQHCRERKAEVTPSPRPGKGNSSSDSGQEPLKWVAEPDTQQKSAAAEMAPHTSLGSQRTNEHK